MPKVVQRKQRRGVEKRTCNQWILITNSSEFSIPFVSKRLLSKKTRNGPSDAEVDKITRLIFMVYFMKIS